MHCVVDCGIIERTYMERRVRHEADVLKVVFLYQHLWVHYVAQEI